MIYIKKGKEPDSLTKYKNKSLLIMMAIKKKMIYEKCF